MVVSPIAIAGHQVAQPHRSENTSLCVEYAYGMRNTLSVHRKVVLVLVSTYFRILSTILFVVVVSAVGAGVGLIQAQLSSHETILRNMNSAEASFGQDEPAQPT